jgi:putative hemolysin
MNMKSCSIFLALSVFTVLLSGCLGQPQAASNTTTTTMAGGDTPGSIKCIQDGGGVQKSSANPDVVYCVFSDGTVCKISDYYQGNCTRGMCKRTCLYAGTFDEGWYDCNGNLILSDICKNETSLKTSC